MKDHDLSPERMIEILEQEVIAAGDDDAKRELVDRTRRRFLGAAALGAAGMAGLAGARPAAAQNASAGPSKPRIMVVYTTDTNTTRRVAERVIAGVNSVGIADPRLLVTGREVSREDMLACDGLIMGTPVRHRTMHHRVKVFVEDVLEQLWLDDAMVGMVGGTFSVGGGHGDAGAGAELCQLSMSAAMAANGMILVTLPKSTPGGDHACLHWGPAVRTGGPKMEAIWPTASALDCAYHHGANVARVTAAIKAADAPLFASGNVSPSPELLAAFRSGASTMETAESVPAPDANPAYRRETDADFPSGDGFRLKSEQ
ncbi:hypothetical protein R5H30_07825 [Sulfitobacter sp. D35]|uniref:hypothetical protein n=1 Tax=Sulfitobacter sp. D35 TaxID=3083252 RepID=UPI00296FAAC4|nr:hypothetical protein [Sulfitobacter sp. D35]MDW4497883.1 hypothetical protein [Sulfitobacter sp. D35]